VIGDGKHAIQVLVEEVNSDPRRGEDHATCLSKFRLMQFRCKRWPNKVSRWIRFRQLAKSAHSPQLRI